MSYNSNSSETEVFEYCLSDEEWEAMVSDRTSQKQRQRYFMEFRERIHWYWQMKAGMRDSKDNSGSDFKVDGEIS